MQLTHVVLLVSSILVVKPIQCGLVDINNSIKSVAAEAVADIAKFVPIYVPQLLNYKGKAVIRTASRGQDFMYIGSKLKNFLGSAGSTFKDVVAEGLASLGRQFTSQSSNSDYDIENPMEYESMGLPPDNLLPMQDDRSLAAVFPGLKPRRRYRIIFTPRKFKGAYGTVQID